MRSTICFVTGLLCVCILSAVAAELNIPAQNPGAVMNAPKVDANVQKLGEIPLHVRIVIDSLYCRDESEWDHGTSQDEPYVMVVGASSSAPYSWTTGQPEVFKDVDSGNNRRFNKQQRVIFEGEVPKNGAVGFVATLWEKDESSSSSVMKVAESIKSSIQDWITSGDPGEWKQGLAKTMVAMWPWLVSQGIYQLGGGADDKIASKEFMFAYDDLLALREKEPYHHAVVVDMDGGDEGHYRLRYHIEFQPLSTREFAARFTGWDDMAVGNLNHTSGDEIVIVVDDDAEGSNGRFYVYDEMGRLDRSFDAPYAPGDRIALGDIDGNSVDEIVVASPSNGGTVKAYDHMGKLKFNEKLPFAKHNGFAVGDVSGDSKAEIIIGKQDGSKVLVYSGTGVKLDEFGLNWSFKGARYTTKDTKHDVFLVGDVAGDEKAEIVMVENKNGPTSVIRVYTGRGSEVINPTPVSNFGCTFTNYDAAAIGNIYGDKKGELILATNHDEKAYSYTIQILDLVSKKKVGTRHYPWYTCYDGFAAGALLAPNSDQIVVANHGDGKVYIGR